MISKPFIFVSHTSYIQLFSRSLCCPLHNDIVASHPHDGIFHLPCAECAASAEEAQTHYALARAATERCRRRLRGTKELGGLRTPCHSNRTFLFSSDTHHLACGTDAGAAVRCAAACVDRRAGTSACKLERQR